MELQERAAVHGECDRLAHEGAKQRDAAAAVQPAPDDRVRIGVRVRVRVRVRVTVRVRVRVRARARARARVRAPALRQHDAPCGVVARSARDRLVPG